MVSDDQENDLKTFPLRMADLRWTHFVLEVLAGADADVGRSLLVHAQSVGRHFVGKSPACDLVLSDPGISRRHTAIEIIDDKVRIADLNSTNGTFVNGTRIVEVFLKGGERIDLGHTALRVKRQEAPVEITARMAPGPSRFGRLIGASREMLRVYSVAERLAKSEVPVLLEGEAGTGKELLAEAIHDASARADAPFVVFDAAASSPRVAEAQLFGTGGSSERPGLLERAHGGTLVIDEVGELALELQSQLLRALERNAVQRVGSATWQPLSVRVIAITRRDLEKEIQEGRFRDDLFGRLAVGRIEMPPLRRRAGDIVVLAEHFWKQLGGSADSLQADVLRKLEGYGWPGNVRELHNAIAHRFVLGDLASGGGPRSASAPDATSDGVPASEDGGLDAASDPIHDVIERNLPFARAKQLVLLGFQRRYLEAALQRYGGNVSRAAAASGIARRYFYVLRSRQPK